MRRRYAPFTPWLRISGPIDARRSQTIVSVYVSNAIAWTSLTTMSENDNPWRARSAAN